MNFYKAPIHKGMGEINSSSVTEGVFVVGTRMRHGSCICKENVSCAWDSISDLKSRRKIGLHYSNAKGNNNI